MDYIHVDLYTDCRSLDKYVNQSGMHSVSDKRLAIDLTGIRQQIWRRQGEETGDPLITDRLPLDASTRLHWVAPLGQYRKDGCRLLDEINATEVIEYSYVRPVD